MPEKEYRYIATCRWQEAKKGLLILDGKPDLAVATPPEFGGHEGLTNPEELFVASAAVCLMSTFTAMSAKTRAEWKSFSCQAEGLLEQVPGQGFLFTRLELRPRVEVASPDQIEPAGKALELAKKYCLVTNSMKSEIVMHPEVVVI